MEKIFSYAFLWFVLCYYNISSLAASLTWKNSTSYPIQVSYAVSFARNDSCVYVFGGKNNTQIPVTNSYKFNITSEEWTKIEPMPNGVYGPTACLANDGRLFIFGYTQLQIYDPINDSWNTTIPKVPSGASIEDSDMSCAVDSSSGLMYIIGGANNGRRFYSYNVSTNTITNLSSSSSSPTPFYLYGQGSFVNNGKLYVFGGLDDSTGYYLSSTYIYDIANNSWSTGRNMTQAAYLFGYATDGSRFYAIGGFRYSYLNYTQVYDISSGEWTIDNGIVNPSGIDHNTAVFLDDSLHSIGGEYNESYLSIHRIASLCGVYANCNESQNSSNAITSSLSSSSSTNTSTDVIVGIVFAVLVLCVIVIVVLITVIGLRRKRRRISSLKSDNQVEIARIPSQSLIELQNHSPRIDSVKIIVKIGGGNFGNVYHGKWNETIDVALKQLKEEEIFEEFIKEATMLQSLNHPNIVRFYGIHNAPNGENFLVMEYMSQGSLDEVLRLEQKQILLEDLLLMAKDAASGMLYLNEKGIIHRDLSLRNLLVTFSTKPRTKYIVKIGDFGMARILDKGYYQSNSKTIPIRWCSPEVLKYGKFTSASDVWAFGVVLWEIFSYGLVPYFPMSNAEVFEKVPKGLRLSIPEKCPEDIYSLMLACWEEEINLRPNFKNLCNWIEKKWEEQFQAQLQTSQLPLPTEKSIQEDSSYTV